MAKRQTGRWHLARQEGFDIARCALFILARCQWPACLLADERRTLVVVLDRRIDLANLAQPSASDAHELDRESFVPFGH